MKWNAECTLRPPHPTSVSDLINVPADKWTLHPIQNLVEILSKGQKDIITVNSGLQLEWDVQTAHLDVMCQTIMG